MPVINLETFIHAPLEICFDLSRSIDLHTISTAATKEKAIGGITTGLISLHETVTWEAVHFGIKQHLTSKITRYMRPFHFRDEQQKGAFKYFIHDHNFEQLRNGIVLMKDSFDFESPFGILGKLINVLVLTKHLKNLLTERNNVIKEFAETNKYKSILG